MNPIVLNTWASDFSAASAVGFDQLFLGQPSETEVFAEAPAMVVASSLQTAFPSPVRFADRGTALAIISHALNRKSSPDDATDNPDVGLIQFQSPYFDFEGFTEDHYIVLSWLKDDQWSTLQDIHESIPRSIHCSQPKPWYLPQGIWEARNDRFGMPRIFRILVELIDMGLAEGIARKEWPSLLFRRTMEGHRARMEWAERQTASVAAEPDAVPEPSPVPAR